MPGLAPEILGALYSAGAAAWPALGLLAGLLVVRLRSRAHQTHDRRTGAEGKREPISSDLRDRGRRDHRQRPARHHPGIQQGGRGDDRLPGGGADRPEHAGAAAPGHAAGARAPNRALFVDDQGTRSLPQGRVGFSGASVDRRMVGRRTPAFYRHPARPLRSAPRASRADQAGGAAPPGAEDGGHRQSDRRHGA